MKVYFSVHPNLSMTALREGSIVRIQFENGVFQTEDPVLQKTIESNIHFGSQIRLLDGVPEMSKEKVSAKRTKKPFVNNFDPLVAVLMEEEVKNHDQKAG